MERLPQNVGKYFPFRFVREFKGKRQGTTFSFLVLGVASFLYSCATLDTVCSRKEASLVERLFPAQRSRQTPVG